MARIYPIGLMFGSIFMLAIPGIIFNNFTSSGLNPAFSLTCSNNPGDFTCQNSNNVGCQSNPSSCSLSGNNISFLNGNSPFTQLIGGNIFSLFGPLTSNGNANRGPFDANGGGQYYTANCFASGITAGTAQNITLSAFTSHITSCTQTNPDGSNMTKANTFTFGDWNFNLLGVAQVNIPFFQIANNATYGLTCFNEGYWFLTNGGSPPTATSIGYATEGCDYYKAAGYSPPQNPIVNPVYSFLIAVPCSLGQNTCKAQTFPTGANHMNIFVQPEIWDTQFCVNTFGTPVSQNQYNWYGSQQCQNMMTWFTSPHAGATFNFGVFTPMLTILLGLVLFLIGTGINVRGGGSIFGSGTTFGVGTNRQGTKLAQVMGIALIVYSFLFSEFSTWFTSGIFPNGLDGTFGVIGITIAAMFWGGAFWQATQA